MFDRWPAFLWSWWRELNPRPHPYQGCALPLSYISNGAENGTQTRDPQLGRLVLYRLSYFRKNPAMEFLQESWLHRVANASIHSPCTRLPRKGATYVAVGADGFEPPKSKTADLQSAPFGHSGTHPFSKITLRASSRTRTNDRWITNLVLYQLSYRGGVARATAQYDSRLRRSCKFLPCSRSSVRVHFVSARPDFVIERRASSRHFRRKSVQRYCFFLNWPNIFRRKIKKNAFLRSLVQILVCFRARTQSYFINISNCIR